MKGAIILYGITRGQGKAVSESLNLTILDLFKKNNIQYEVYLHAWLCDSNLEIRNKNDWKLFQPNHSLVSSQSQFDKSINYQEYTDGAGLGHCKNIPNLVRALTSLKRAYKLTKNKNYDFFLIGRLDTLFISNDGILDSILNVKRNDNPLTFTPSWHKWKGTNDRFCISNRKGADIYCNRIDFLKENKKLNYNSERFLCNMLKMHNVKNHELGAVVKRLRENGEIASLDRRLPVKRSKCKLKIFCIGLHKTGTSTLHEIAKVQGLKSIHNPRWPVNHKIIDNNNFFCDGGSHYDGQNEINFEMLGQKYKNCKFILNIRDIKPWIISKLKHAGWTHDTIIQPDADHYRHDQWKIKSEKNIKLFIDHYYNRYIKILNYFQRTADKLFYVDICNQDIESLKILFKVSNIDLPWKNRNNSTNSLSNEVNNIIDRHLAKNSHKADELNTLIGDRPTNNKKRI